jgi:GTP-binding protein EngB required for normal cell division
MKTLRYLLAAIVALLFLLIVVLIGMAGDTLLSLWDRLQQAPWFVGALFSTLLAGFAIASGYVIWKLLRPPTASHKKAEVITEDSLMDRVGAAEASGLDINQAHRELQELSRRRESGTLYIALFGTISTGKSSLVHVLLPDAEVSIDVAGGSTSSVSRYVWMTPGGDQITLIDMPGLHDPKATLDRKLVDEASRAHMVIYLCDGDLTRTQLDEIQSLARLGKPMILALNKQDWFSDAERSVILERLRERTRDIGDIEVVGISTRTQASVHVRDADGTETTELREMKPDIAPLARALQRRIDSDPHKLEQLRDAAVFTLASQALDDAELSHRLQRGEQIARNHTRSAVLGALAAISPGSDIIIQGAIGISLVKSLCSLYDLPVSQLEIDRLLKLAQTRINRHVTLIFAVAGNAMKAFPGIGTVAGGMLHAVTYGMIFDALGRSLNETLASRGELANLPVINRFTESLGDQLEKRTGDIVRLVLDAKKERPDKD